jgi:flagellar hook-associated protein 2
VLTAELSGGNAVRGSFDVVVTALASATVGTSSNYLGQVIDPDAALDSAGFSLAPTSGTFTINGTEITIDVTTDSLNDVINMIDTNTNVTAAFNLTTNKISLTNDGPTDTDIINLGASSDTSNFLESARLTGATQTGTPTTLESTVDVAVINPADTLDNIFGVGAVTAGTFQINGTTITITDPSTETLDDVLTAVNSSDAGVTVSFDASTDTVRVISDTLGSRTIDFTDGTSGFLAATYLDTADQTAGTDAQFTVDGQSMTRNTNAVTDAIGGISFTLLSTGTSTITVNDDYEAMIEDVTEFVDAYNTAVQTIHNELGQGGELENDGSIRLIENYLRSTIFGRPTGVSGDYESLADIGITTGDTFERGALSMLEVDEGTLREALETDPDDVASIFTNAAEDGIGDLFEGYLRDLTSTTGFLQSRSEPNGTISDRIDAFNDRIDAIERRLGWKEERLRRQFTQMEIALSQFQAIGAFLAARFATLE